ncbi:MAG: HAD family hydrolase [Pigmentiphaga sp.]|nr:HAD family hydrolase [Pigmentiphaga sp.]
MALSPAVFLDKDGTLLEDVPYNVDPGDMRWAAGAKRGVQALAARGWPLVVVSNQPGVALGRFEPQALGGVAQRLSQLFREAGARLSGFYWCPHHPAGAVDPYAGPCDCRKPAPGLLLRAATDLGIRLSDSWMVGDILDDVEAGRRAGCRTILLDVGNETEWRTGPLCTPHFLAPDLAEASRMIGARP